MKYCKKCGVLYTTDVCPKCGVIAPESSDPDAPVDRKTVRRHWITLGFAIPFAILLIMSVVYLFKTILS